MPIDLVPRHLREIPDPLLQGYLERLMARPSPPRKAIEAVFLELLRRHQESVLTYIGWVVKDPYHLEDLTDITLTKSFDNLSSYRSRQPFQSWLFRFARETVLNHLRALGPDREPLMAWVETGAGPTAAADSKRVWKEREEYCQLGERCGEERDRRLLDAWIRNRFDHQSWSEIHRVMSWDMKPDSLRIACFRLVKSLQRVW